MGPPKGRLEAARSWKSGRVGALYLPPIKTKEEKGSGNEGDAFKHGIATVAFIGGQPNRLCNGAPHSRMLRRSKTTSGRDC